MLGTAAHQEGSTDTTQAAAANLLHQWRVCLVHLWVHTQDETGLSLPEKGIFIARVSPNSTLLLAAATPMISQQKEPSTSALPSLLSQSHTDYNTAVLALQILMAEDDQRLLVWSCPASELWKWSAAENQVSPAPWRVSDIFKWHSWQQREGLLVPSLLGHWFIFSG